MTLTAQAREAQRTAALLCARDHALTELCTLLDPNGTRSAWSVAGDVAVLLKRFSGEPARRVLSGARPARGAIEPHLLALVEADCPTSQRRICDVLRELTSVVS